MSEAGIFSLYFITDNSKSPPLIATYKRHGGASKKNTSHWHIINHPYQRTPFRSIARVVKEKERRLECATSNVSHTMFSFLSQHTWLLNTSTGAALRAASRRHSRDSVLQKKPCLLPCYVHLCCEHVAIASLSIAVPYNVALSEEGKQ